MLARPVNPWTPWFDKTFAVIVRAIDERSARSYAQGVAGNERRGVYRAFGDLADEVAADVWLDGDYTTCTTLTEDGDPGAADASGAAPWSCSLLSAEPVLVRGRSRSATEPPRPPNRGRPRAHARPASELRGG